MLCEGGCRVNPVAKFGDFRRLVVEVLQWRRCVELGEEENGLKMASVGEFSGFLGLVSCSLLLGESTRERGRSGCVLDVF